MKKNNSKKCIALNPKTSNWNKFLIFCSHCHSNNSEKENPFNDPKLIIANLMLTLFGLINFGIHANSASDSSTSSNGMNYDEHEEADITNNVLIFIQAAILFSQGIFLTKNKTHCSENLDIMATFSVALSDMAYATIKSTLHFLPEDPNNQTHDITNSSITNQSTLNTNNNLNGSLRYLGLISLSMFTTKFILLSIKNALKLRKNKTDKDIYNLTITSAISAAETVLLCGALNLLRTTLSAPIGGSTFLLTGLFALTTKLLSMKETIPHPDRLPR